MPKPWLAFGHRLVSSDILFELDELPASMAVIGLGPLGLELAQAMQWLGEWTLWQSIRDNTSEV